MYLKGGLFISTATATLTFAPFTIEDKQWMDQALRTGHRGALEYNFTSNFIWREIYKLQVARFENRLVVMSDPQNPTFIFPSGTGPVDGVIRALDQYTRELGVPLVFNTVLNEDKERIEAAFPGKFRFEPDRNDYDYIYESQRMITLSGKKLSAKRNHINRFKVEHQNWSYEPITKDNIQDARQMSQEWCRLAGCNDNEELFDESCAVEQAFKHFFDLGLAGGLLRDGEKVIAFAMGEPLNEDTFLVHIEKAFHDIQGSYQMINQLFATENAQGFTYINREDDAGDEGLRRAKLSYYPDFLIEKSAAFLVDTL